MKRTWIFALIVTLATAALIVPLSARFFRRPSTLSKCPESAIDASNSTEKIRASKIIVEPWEGRHNVYGIFVLPAGYESKDYFAVNLDGSTTYCGGVTMLNYSVHGVNIKPGERIAIGHLKTRTALWLLTKGKQEELTQPNNWLLSTDRPG